MDRPCGDISAVATMMGLLSALTDSDVRTGMGPIYREYPKISSTALVHTSVTSFGGAEFLSSASPNTALLYGMALNVDLPGSADAGNFFRLIESGRISAKTLVYFYERAVEAASGYFRETATRGEDFLSEYEITELVFNSLADNLEAAIAADPDFAKLGNHYLEGLGNCTEVIESLVIHAVADARILFLRNSAAGKVADVSVE